MLGTIWFLLWGLLWAIYFVLDGYDLGLGMTMPVVAKREADRKLIYRTMGPFWDGNEVWLIAAGAITFAAFPAAYATLFSALMAPLMLILIALILRGATFPFRDKLGPSRWRGLWDAAFASASLLVSFLLGVAFANLFRGLALTADGVVQGGLLALLHPYALAGGLLFVVMLAFHGTLWLATKASGELHRHSARLANRLWIALVVGALLFLIASATSTSLYANYLARPVLFAIPAVAVVALVAARALMATGQWWPAWFASAAVVVATTVLGVVGLYPNLIRSSLDPAYSLTIANAASSPLTLKVMLVVVAAFLPVVLLCQIWVHRVFGTSLANEEAAYEEGHAAAV